ncbi:MAG: nucleoside permease [Bacteroidetes Order II. Incertae sedis bacterium]|jgi:nucleoside transporter|nr:nucleoside permease [Bacteroidetes Order II. bacterium]HAY36171.1 MFS transporter [Bacteroidota bacterium]MBT4602950.1 nucleoside permease [Bacteroidetes Order II. bacterium]MBT6423961.1 nucleoside permease [Bacteroidetes Order II. bacterium]MBT6597718.1 nucleoside permease [Bacteroidetes Order II. bacterium]
MNTSSTTARLSIMMFLQFFVWGAWYVTVGIYMGENGMGDISHWAYTVGPLAAVISPFFLGMIADRYFSVEKVLGVMHILGGAAILAAPFAVDSPVTFILLLAFHMLCYMPTIGLTNTLAFHNITDQEKQFPLLRVFGTIGWIVAGVFVSLGLKAETTAVPFYVAGISGLLMGVFSFSLPHTPPPAADKGKITVREVLGLDALAQLNSRPFNVFILSSFLICIPLATYYNFAPIFANDVAISNVAFKMSFGQMSEVLFMLLMPFFFRRLGVKWMLLVGMAAWVLRYALFAFAATEGVAWMIMFGIILHGICYDFFFVTGQIYVDKKSTPEIRGQAQGFLVFVTLGAGMLIGAQVSGWLNNFYKAGNEVLTATAWQSFWWVPAIFAAVIMVFFLLMFKDEVDSSEVNV